MLGSFDPVGGQRLGPGDNMPSKEMLEQFMRQDGPPAGFEDSEPPSR